MEITEAGGVVWIYKDKPPLKIRNLAKRVAARHPRQTFVFRWLRCSRGCAHGRAFGFMPSATRHLLDAKPSLPSSGRCSYIRLYYGSSEEENAIIVLHEMAHHLGGTKHNDWFYRELLKEADAEGMVRAVMNYHGHNAKRVWRQMKVSRAA